MAEPVCTWLKTSMFSAAAFEIGCRLPFGARKYKSSRAPEFVMSSSPDRFQSTWVM